MTFNEKENLSKVTRSKGMTKMRFFWLLHCSFTGKWQNAELSFQGCLSTPTANWSNMRKRGICYSHSLCPSRWWERAEYEWNRVKGKDFRRWKQDLKGSWCNLTNFGINTGWMPIKNAGWMSNRYTRVTWFSLSAFSPGLSIALG